MPINQKVIQTAYHFFSEGIILFLLLGPFFHFTYGGIPYWTGVGSLMIVTITFSLLTQFSDRIIWFLLVAPFIGIGYFFVLDVSFFMSIVIVSVLMWRYIVLRQESHLENEKKYLVVTTILVIIYVLIARENNAVIYLIMQFFTLIIGYIMNHTVSVQHQKKRMTYGLGKLFVSLILLLVVSMGLLHLFGVPILFMFWDVVVVNIWQGIVLAVAYISVAIMYVLEFLIKLLPNSNESEFHSNHAEVGVAEEEGLESSPVEMLDINLGWIFTLLLVAFLLYQAVKIYRKRFKQDGEQEIISVTHMPLEEKRGRKPIMTRLRERFFSQPIDPIRKVMYQFEREAEKRQQGRRPSETLTEWFARIDLGANIDAYEKVRYGGGQASSMEVKQLSNQLKDWFSKGSARK